LSWAVAGSMGWVVMGILVDHTFAAVVGNLVVAYLAASSAVVGSLAVRTFVVAEVGNLVVAYLAASFAIVGNPSAAVVGILAATCLAASSTAVVDSPAVAYLVASSVAEVGSLVVAFAIVVPWQLQQLLQQLRQRRQPSSDLALRSQYTWSEG